MRASTTAAGGSADDAALLARVAGHPRAAALIAHSLGGLGPHRQPALKRAYAEQPTAYFDDMESQIGAVLRASGQDLTACLEDLDAFNALTEDVENDAWYDRPAAFTSMHLDTLLLGFGRRRLQALARQLRTRRAVDANLLEVGSGSGWLVDLLLSEHQGWRATLADRSAAARDFAEGLLAARGHAPRAACHRSSLERLPFADAAFDIVIAAEVIEHCPDPAAGARELLRVLAPQGHLVISLPLALDIAMHPTVFADEDEMLSFFRDLGLSPHFTEVVEPDPGLDAICDVFPGFRGCVNATFGRS